jgi:dTDP-glucose pyrophosphorylase
MSKLRELVCVDESVPLLVVLSCLQNAHGICVVENQEGRVVGTITDGDCRRMLLRTGGDVQIQARSIMNRHFIALDRVLPREQLESLMRVNKVKQILLLDEHHRLVDLLTGDSRPETSPSALNQVLILAGGLGSRLRPHTYTTPKPLLKIGGKPMVQHLIERLVESGFQEIFLSVNYLAEKFEQHFGDGSAFGCNIHYLKEEKPLGTAGPLTLLPAPDLPILMLNGDLVTEVNFWALMDFHNVRQDALTICVSGYEHQVPFGVVDMNEDLDVIEIREKPINKCLVNSGIYVISPRLLKQVPVGEYFLVTELIDQCVSSNLKVGAFPVHEYWRDVGLPETYAEVDVTYSNRLPKAVAE